MLLGFRHSRAGGNPGNNEDADPLEYAVIPAQAGIQATAENLSGNGSSFG